jgi:hypothetical protein
VAATSRSRYAPPGDLRRHVPADRQERARATGVVTEQRRDVLQSGGDGGPAPGWAFPVEGLDHPVARAAVREQLLNRRVI